MVLNAGPLVGVKVVIAGAPAGLVMVKVPTLLAFPPEAVTLIRPVVAQSGTVAVIEEGELKVTLDEFTPLKLTLAGQVKFLPVTVTVVPAGALVGVKHVIVARSPMATQ